MCLSVPGKILGITDAGRCLATADTNGRRQEINLLFLVDADNPIDSWVGRWVCFHSGFATERIDVETAHMLMTFSSPP